MYADSDFLETGVEDPENLQLQVPRWYPSGLIMANGSVLIVGKSSSRPINVLLRSIEKFIENYDQCPTVTGQFYF